MKARRELLNFGNTRSANNANIKNRIPTSTLTILRSLKYSNDSEGFVSNNADIIIKLGWP
ncbi:hypothetical protein AFI02nite_17560 [Aliivibrio fischeri]|uniref:Uncharacterized protein n=1 Tax=Aliivibrio fischeri TaxID=668 RepID=A0A510UK35_ALIFS|nr:hypothetical protein AFI02nite_17560 [Aliivibrio fischeri]